MTALPEEAPAVHTGSIVLRSQSRTVRRVLGEHRAERWS